ncbi:MAG TPA: mitofilin family membrane protein [Stellaceae bacterium]|nr:mitofilin family membrane protein [Stellaceae bacterium]
MSEPPVIEAKAADVDLQRRRRRRATVIGGLAGALILILGLTGTSPYWAPPLARVLPWGRPADDSNRQVLAEQLATVESEIKALRDAQGADAQLAVRLDALEKQIQQAQRSAPDGSQTADAVKRLDETTQRLQAAIDGDAERIAALQARLTRSGDNPERMLFLALSQLATAVATSRPFPAELKAAETLAPHDLAAKLLTLEPLAVTGIPSTAALAARFDAAAAPAMLMATPSPAAEAGWTERLWAKLSSLVIVRRVGVGATPPDPTVAAVDAARAELAQGDLTGAVGAIERAPAPARDAARDWLTVAHRRLDAEATIAAALQEVAPALAASSKAPAVKPATQTP